jgi:two-component system alkaline phosphatase synthesis response regulator PhoP
MPKGAEGPLGILATIGWWRTMIYYVEDDTNIRDLALYALRQSGLDAQGFACAAEFYDALHRRMPQAVLLDIMLPETDGLQILHRLREDSATANLPVMMITAKGTEYDTVTGLDAGADDYLAKPFGMMELVSRVKALLRRSGMPSSSAIDKLICGPIELSPRSHTVTVGGVSVELTLKEFDLLRELMGNEGRVMTRDQLLEDVWSITYAGGTRTVDVHVQTLRSKLAAVLPGSESCIKTVRGVGYAMKGDAS